MYFLFNFLFSFCSKFTLQFQVFDRLKLIQFNRSFTTTIDWCDDCVINSHSFRIYFVIVKNQIYFFQWQFKFELKNQSINSFWKQTIGRSQLFTPLGHDTVKKRSNSKTKRSNSKNIRIQKKTFELFWKWNKPFVWCVDFEVEKAGKILNFLLMNKL